MLRFGRGWGPGSVARSGWIVGYVGRVPVAHRSLLFGTLDALVVASIAVGLFFLWGPWREGGEIVKTDGEALDLVRRVAKAEHAFRERRVKDVNGDGIAEYGTLADLKAAGLVRETSTAGAAVVLPGGERVEVLLPDRLSREHRRLLSRAGGPVDPVLAADSFAVVSLPTGDRKGGLRAYYLDEQDRLWYADEVTSPDRGTALVPPAYALEQDTEDDASPGPLWFREKGSSSASTPP